MVFMSSLSAPGSLQFPPYAEWKTLVAARRHSADPAWKEEVASRNFFKSIKLNIETFENTLAAGKEVDPGFVAILERDIVMLSQAHNPDTEAHLCEELYGMGRRIHAAAMRRGQTGAHPSSGKATDVAELSVGPIVPLRSIGSSGAAAVDQGLRLLEERGFSVRRVRKDGNCLFSSIAAHLMTPEQMALLKNNVPALMQEGIVNAKARPDADDQRLFQSFV